VRRFIGGGAIDASDHLDGAAGTDQALAEIVGLCVVQRQGQQWSAAARAHRVGRRLARHQHPAGEGTTVRATLPARQRAHGPERIMLPYAEAISSMSAAGPDAVHEGAADVLIAAAQRDGAGRDRHRQPWLWAGRVGRCSEASPRP
jgi:hypothetical protein